MSNYNIAAVPFNLVDLIWDKVVPHLQRVVDRAHGEVTLDSVKSRIKSGEVVLVTVSRGTDIIAINTLELRIMDSGLRTMFIPIVGGAELDDWMEDFLKIARAIAKDYNCTELRGLAVRPGWMKKLQPHGWENVHMIVRCDIEGDT